MILEVWLARTQAIIRGEGEVEKGEGDDYFLKFEKGKQEIG